MGRNLDEVIKSLPADRQAKIAALSQKKVEEMIAHAATLTDFRKAVGKTQAEVAKVLGINQNAVSQLEKRSDTYVSTLRRFLKSLGMTLELSVVAKNGVRIDLPNFLPWNDAEVAASEPEAFASITTPPLAKAARNVAAKAPPAKKIATRKSSPGTTTKKTGASHKPVDIE
ncbi:XRE family transcriptional regulator [Massilia cavernae]|uniref:Helix-turn-helix domain-containing protein n=1 Tax=Massilia cavernae TaxID=2320864 RepID=A0A418XT19_9BURK|nr:XRE family transcriptional regulator [Massilia cavernae]RJG15705.1 helix-turn-helix domain-containing protein [Massilia cavernae]